ncbi:MAG: isoprenylcysteine carboxylmethyltransferase family protein [Anaerolineales bacterium]
MDRYKKWAEREYPITSRILALIPAGLLIVVLIPYFLIRSGPAIDRALGLPSFQLGLAGLIAGVILIVVGMVYALWSIVSQMTRASGTPLPVMPTQKLLISPPFDQCRNPMTLGTILAYLGISVILGSTSGVILAVLISTLLICYLKFIEEKELEARFGEEYLTYKSRTPFIIPRLPKK